MLLCLTLLLSVSVAGGGTSGKFSIKAAAENFNAGDTFYYGNYPQSDVTSSLGSILDSLGGTWKSYGYYQGDGSEGSMAPSDYMRYKDVFYEGIKYRGVTFDTYRPDWTRYESTESCDASQRSNGYTNGNVYWFKFEPVKWRVLDPSSGLVMCETVIDSQPYSSYFLPYGRDNYNLERRGGHELRERLREQQHQAVAE